MSWQDILKNKKDDTINPTDYDETTANPNEDATGAGFRKEVQDWLNKYTPSEYFGHYYTLSLKWAYSALHKYILPHARANEGAQFKGDGFPVIVGPNFEYGEQSGKEHPKLKQAQKEIEEIASRWDKEARKNPDLYGEVTEREWETGW